MERKHKEDIRKAFVETEKLGREGAEGLFEIRHSQSSTLPDCALQIRLSDGTTLRSRFSPEQNIQGNVRRWIDAQRTDGDAPYTFRQVLAPWPNHNISISEEEQSLQSLGLTPSATLIMVPVRGYTAAYGGDYGYLSKGLAAGSDVISGGVNWLTGVMGTLIGTGSASASQPKHEITEAHTDATHVASTSAINVRTLRDQQRNRDSQQFYNGNQLNFESRRDEDSNDDQL